MQAHFIGHCQLEWFGCFCPPWYFGLIDDPYRQFSVLPVSYKLSQFWSSLSFHGYFTPPKILTNEPTEVIFLVCVYGFISLIDPNLLVDWLAMILMSLRPVGYILDPMTVVPPRGCWGAVYRSCSLAYQDCIGLCIENLDNVCLPCLPIYKHVRKYFGCLLGKLSVSLPLT